MLITWTRSQWILNENSKTDLSFEFDFNSRKFEDFDSIQSLTMKIKVQVKCLTSGMLQPNCF
jgi:hypothetical protein